MAWKSRQHGVDTWSIASADGSTKATLVPDLGGIVSSLMMSVSGRPRELLYRHDHFWNPDTTETRGGMPILFPICGRLILDGARGRWRHEGRDRHLPLHGFAMRRPWVVLDHRRPDELALGMVDGNDTLQDYPFHFELVLRFLLGPGRLTCRVSCRNRGDRPMPFSLGFHPYFLAPSGPEKNELRVHLSARKRLHYDAGYASFAGEAAVPEGGLAPNDALFSDALNVLDPPGGIQIDIPDGPRLRLLARGESETAMFPFVQLHAQEGLPFVCVEPWSAAPNALNTGNDLRWLDGGAAEHAALTIEAT